MWICTQISPSMKMRFKCVHVNARSIPLSEYLPCSPWGHAHGACVALHLWSRQRSWENNKYHRCGFLSTCAYCKISKKPCAYIQGALKDPYQIGHTHVGWVDYAHTINMQAQGGIRRVLFARRWRSTPVLQLSFAQPRQLCFTGICFVLLSTLRCAYFPVYRPGRKYVLISKYALNPQCA